MNKNEHKLNNPVWHSLNETHKNNAITHQSIKFYKPEYCPFGGFTDREQATQGITEYSARIDRFFVVGEKPLVNSPMIIKRDLVCNQMLLRQPIDMEISEPIVEMKEEKQREELFDLVNLVQPGYFKNKTVELGKYFGIYKDNQLVAVSGERMKMNDFTEISAIVMHPNHRGKGYAKQLIKQMTDQVFSDGKLPYLHVVETNVGAVGLYEKLGFVTRRKISFWDLGLR